VMVRRFESKLRHENLASESMRRGWSVEPAAA
jgi:hypothetical protein